MPTRARVLELHERWRDEGFLILPRFFHALAVQRLRQLCDSVLAQWRGLRGTLGDTTNLAEMTDARWWLERDDDLVAFLELVAEPRALALVEALTGGPPLLQGTQYFMEPLARSWTGAWHRDSQFLVAPGRDEAAIRSGLTGLHARVALVPDDNLELLPGSQARDDSPAEAQVRDIEERLAHHQQQPDDRERDARTLAVLVKTMRELAALDSSRIVITRL